MHKYVVCVIGRLARRATCAHCRPLVRVSLHRLGYMRRKYSGEKGHTEVTMCSQSFNTYNVINFSLPYIEYSTDEPLLSLFYFIIVFFFLVEILSLPENTSWVLHLLPPET